MRKVFALIGLCHGAAVFAMKLRSRRRRVSLAKSPSAAFSHAEVACSERRSRAATRDLGMLVGGVVVEFAWMILRTSVSTGFGEAEELLVRVTPSGSQTTPSCRCARSRGPSFRLGPFLSTGAVMRFPAPGSATSRRPTRETASSG